MKINIKPLSVNACFRGRRFRTPEYDAYEKELFYLLPKSLRVNPQKELSIAIAVGLSNRNMDIDNCAKCFIDVLQKFYTFNDKNIFKLFMEKEIVKKGQEYIIFNIQEL